MLILSLLIYFFFSATHSTGACDRRFYPIFNKRFCKLETLLTMQGSAKVLSDGLPWAPLVPSLQSRSLKGTFILPQKYHASISNIFSQPLVSFIQIESQNKFLRSSLSQTLPPLQISGSRILFYPIRIMPQISTEDSGMLQLTKNAKTNNNIVGYHLVSRRVISTLSDVQHVYGCPKKDFHITPKVLSSSFKYNIIAT